MLGRRLAPLALLLAIAAAGCGSTPTATPATPPTASLAPGASAAPAQTAGASPAAGSSGPTSAPSDTSAPTAAPSGTSSPAVETSTPPAGGVGSAACSGSAENQDFFAAAAQAFSWDVYCAVLPEGWFVDTGSFRLADGGTLVVTYRGPGDTRIELQEGAWCTARGSACSPRDHDLGTAPFGDRSGELVSLGPDVKDGFATYVDPGAAPSWALTGTGMDRAAFEAIAAALHRVAA